MFRLRRLFSWLIFDFLSHWLPPIKILLPCMKYVVITLHFVRHFLRLSTFLSLFFQRFGMEMIDCQMISIDWFRIDYLRSIDVLSPELCTGWFLYLILRWRGWFSGLPVRRLRGWFSRFRLKLCVSFFWWFSFLWCWFSLFLFFFMNARPIFSFTLRLFFWFSFFSWFFFIYFDSFLPRRWLFLHFLHWWASGIDFFHYFIDVDISFSVLLFLEAPFFSDVGIFSPLFRFDFFFVSFFFIDWLFHYLMPWCLLSFHWFSIAWIFLMIIDYFLRDYFWLLFRQH